MNFSFIFIGSTHSFLDDFSKQKEIISLVNPEFVLNEELENWELDTEDKFKEILKKRHISEMTTFDEFKDLISFCFNKKINLIGIDFHNFGFKVNLQRKIKNQEKLTHEEEKEINRLNKLREKHHLSKILEYKEKTTKPLVIILGCWHLRTNSLLRKKLKNYKIIAPIDKNGKVLFQPGEREKIKYGEIISNDAKVKD